MSGGSRDSTYDSDVTVYSGPNGCSLTDAPPMTPRRSRTSVSSPARAR